MKIPRDKLRHFIVGAFAGAFLQGVALLVFGGNMTSSIIGAFLAVLAINYGFELFSAITKIGVYDLLDAVAGTIGGLLGMLIVLAFTLMV